MFREEKHLKDSSADLGISVKDTPNFISYTKTDKLIIALYMVTDIIDRDEPLRNKLRTLGTGIISDIASEPVRAVAKVSEVMSFLDIAQALNIISQMNASILRKEFAELTEAIRESGENKAILDRKVDIAEFLTEEDEETHPSLLRDNHHHSLPDRSRNHMHNGHLPTRLGVQKGSTLLHAIKGVSDRLPVGHPANNSDKHHGHVNHEQFDAMKKHRREDILNIIKIIGGSATIKDIKDKASSIPSSLKDCGEKTLQRELVSMVHDGVLKKQGTKRWSRYFVK